MEQGTRTYIEDHYEIGNEIGVGTSSFVHTATHIETNTEYAVKIIDKTSLSSKQRERLSLEVEILRNLDHPHIISLRDTFETDDSYYIVMDLMKGGDLFDKIVQKKRYTEQEARITIRNIVHAIEYLHKKGLVHRDLKPENMLLPSKIDCTEIKIADFGFSRVVKDGHLLTTPCGSPGYVAPEIANEQGYTKDVDMWSIGVILYTLLAGYPPFYADDDDELLDLISEGKYNFNGEYWKEISSAGKDLIRKLLEKNTSLRYTARQVLSHPWIVGDESFENNSQDSEMTQSPPTSQSHIRSAVNKCIDVKRDGCFMRSATESSIMKRRRLKKKEQLGNCSKSFRDFEDISDELCSPFSNQSSDENELIFELDLMP